MSSALKCFFFTALIALVLPCTSILAADTWETDYSTAVRKATTEKKMLLLYFADASVPATTEAAWLADATTAKSLASYVLLKVPTTAEMATAEGSTRLLSHSAFSEMQGSAGFSILDYTNEKSLYFCLLYTSPIPRD